MQPAAICLHQRSSPPMRPRTEDPLFNQLSAPLPRFGGPTFHLRFRMQRRLGLTVWAMLAAWPPPPFRRWRSSLLRLFGAQIDPTAVVYGKAVIWWPGHLVMGKFAVLGPGVICYNTARITIDD